MKHFLTTKPLFLVLTVFLSAFIGACKDDDDKPDMPDSKKPQLTVDIQALDFSSDKNSLEMPITVTEETKCDISTHHSWLIPESKTLDLKPGTNKLTLKVDRYSKPIGDYSSSVILQTDGQRVEIPVNMTVDHFMPYGKCESLTSCDSRIGVTYYGCYKSGRDVKLMFQVSNLSSSDINGFKLWTHPTYTYLIDDKGNRYDKDSGMSAVLGNKSDTGDIMIPIASGETVLCQLNIQNVADNAQSFTHVVAGMYNYGTGDFTCSGKSIELQNVEWDDIDKLFN